MMKTPWNYSLHVSEYSWVIWTLVLLNSEVTSMQLTLKLGQ